MTDAPITRIRDTFVSLLKQELSADDWREMLRRNGSAEYARTGCCASHDFTDANMVMADADISDVAARAYSVIVESDPDARDGHAELLAELRVLAQRGGRLTGTY